MNHQNKSNGRSLSRQLLGNELDLVNKYAHKYGVSGGHGHGHSNSPHYGPHSGNPFGASAPAPNALSQSKSHPSGYGGNNYNNGYPGYNHNGFGGGGGGGGGYGHGYSTGSGSSNGSGGYNRRKQRTRTPSNLINSHNGNQWDAQSVGSQQEEMQQALGAMVGNFTVSVNQEAAFLDEIEAEAEENGNFGKMERADEWSVKEVCHWLNKIHLDKYIGNFRNQIIDGSILLRDLDEAMLIKELGIKRLHVKKVLREIAKLKAKCPKIKKENNDNRDDLIQSLRVEIEELRSKNKRLWQELDNCRHRYGHVTSNSINSMYSSKGDSTKSKF